MVGSIKEKYILPHGLIVGFLSNRKRVSVKLLHVNDFLIAVCNPSIFYASVTVVPPEMIARL
jgi:hypothetical protein